MKRYTIWCAATHGHQPMERDNGEMVTYDDAIALARRVAVFAWLRSNGKRPQAEDIDAIIAEASRNE